MLLKPFGSQIFKWLHLIPIYRLSGRKRKFKYIHFWNVYFLIKTTKNHSDFSEGICKNEWNLRPLKKELHDGFDDGSE
jgi:hypothetical protein